MDRENSGHCGWRSIVQIADRRRNLQPKVRLQWSCHRLRLRLSCSVTNMLITNINFNYASVKSNTFCIDTSYCHYLLLFKTGYFKLQGIRNYMDKETVYDEVHFFPHQLSLES